MDIRIIPFCDKLFFYLFVDSILSRANRARTDKTAIFMMVRIANYKFYFYFSVMKIVAHSVTHLREYSLLRPLCHTW